MATALVILPARGAEAYPTVLTANCSWPTPYTYLVADATPGSYAHFAGFEGTDTLGGYDFEVSGTIGSSGTESSLLGSHSSYVVELVTFSDIQLPEHDWRLVCSS